MRAAALPVARSLGIDPALVTCDESNTGSRRVIEGNGGMLARQRTALLGPDRRLTASAAVRERGSPA